MGVAIGRVGKGLELVTPAVWESSLQFRVMSMRELSAAAAAAVKTGMMILFYCSNKCPFIKSWAQVSCSSCPVFLQSKVGFDCSFRGVLCNNILTNRREHT